MKRKGHKRQWQFRMEDCPPFPVIPGIEIRHLLGHIGIACASDGEVWSCRNQGWGGKWRKLSRRSRNSDGYAGSTVKAKNARGLKTLKFASAICAAFHGPRPTSKMEACHKDGSRDNDRPDNLYWGTAEQNRADMVRHGRTTGVQSHLTNTCKLTIKQVLTIRELLVANVPVAEIADIYSVTRSTIFGIKNRRTWKKTF